MQPHFNLINVRLTPSGSPTFLTLFPLCPFMSSFSTFRIAAFIDDWFKEEILKLRQRGPEPTLHDSEVLTIELVGAFLGMSTDKEVFNRFRRHWGDWFPGLRHIHRTTYVRQSANLWQVKSLLWQNLLGHIAMDPAFSIIDSFPLPVCRFARANRCRRLREISAYGYDEVARQTFAVYLCQQNGVSSLRFAELVAD